MIHVEERGGTKGCCASPNAVWKWNILHILLVVVLGSLVQVAEYAEARHSTSQCVQLGQAHASANGFPYRDTRRMGPWTIGTRKFDIIYTFLDMICSTWQPSCYDESIQLCPYKKLFTSATCKPNGGDCGELAEPCVVDKQVEVRTYAVKQNGNVMYGWLHFEFELKDKDDDILAIYVQVRDEYFNAIGEFVSDSKEQCQPSKSNLVQPTEFQILPCSAVGFREAKLSNAIFMAEKNIYRNQTLVEKFIPVQPISRGIHFTWRLSEYWCNRHLRFRPEATILTKKIIAKDEIGYGKGRYNEPLIYRKAPKYWLRPRWFGTADIKLPKTTLSCNERAIDYSNGKVDQKQAPWLHQEGILGKLDMEYLSAKQFYKDNSSGTPIGSLKSCQWNVRKTNLPTNLNAPFGKDIAPTFAGRCKTHFEKTVDHFQLQGCELDSSKPEFEDLVALNFPNYTTWIQNLTINRTSLCSVPCILPTAENLTDITSFKDRTEEYKWHQTVRYNSASRNSSKIEKILVGKKYHATLCVIWTMFLTPLGIFCARYFKETCMNVTCSGAHFWFWVHVATAVAASAVFISSLSGIWSNLETWGRNKDPAGNGHRMVGYMSITLFVLMIILGGLRPLQKKLRFVIMTAHSVIGFLIYFLNHLAMLMSFFIPGSPTIGQCDEMGYSTEMSTAIYPILIWILIDTCLHIAMTVLQVIKDRSVGLRRPWYCPIIPILPHDSADDFVGSSLRKITLMVYAGAAFIMTNITIGLIMGDDVPPKECQERTGSVSCTRIWGCSASAMAYEQKISSSKNESGSYSA